MLEQGHRITAIDLEHNTKRWELILTPAQIEQVQFRAVRIEEAEKVKKVFDEMTPDAVIHLAGLQVPACRANPISGAKVNVIGTLAIFEAALSLSKRPKVVYASSAAVFGSDADYDTPSVGNSAMPKPSTHYGAFKLCNEYCAQAYWVDKQFPSVGFRPLTVYGPGRDIGLTSFPSRAIAAALLGECLEIPFQSVTTYIYVEEVADFLISAALQPQHAAISYTMGGDAVDTPTFIKTLDQQIPGAIERITYSEAHLPIASHLDDHELRRAYPKVSRISLDEGIRRTIEIYRAAIARGRRAL